MYDVIIIGAGPAGTCCAKKLAENGFSVKVFDRRREIGSPKRCGEGLSESIKQYVGEIPERCIAKRIKGSRIYAPNGKSVDALLEYGGFVLERKVFDKWLAERAVKAGAVIQSDSFISELIKEDGKFVGVKGEFVGDKFEERAKVIVCATGAESPLRKQALGIVSNPDVIDSCLQYEMSGIDFDPDFIHIYVGHDISPRGYVWIFPKGKDRANVGVGIIPGEKTAKFYLNNFIEKHPGLKKGSIIEVNGGCVPVGGMEKNMVADGFLVCGEAAHQVNPIHGGGIKEAVISGILAADVISECLKRGNVSEKALSIFNKLWWDERGHLMRNVEKLREVVEKLSDEDLNDLADALNPNDIIEFSRGAKLSTLAKILMRKPRLVTLAKHLL
ncbi:MAG: NAD(P)/FAD-dependent oxidoreductase [Candidatus Aenigmatarchaeota archaeon]